MAKPHAQCQSGLNSTVQANKAVSSSIYRRYQFRVRRYFSHPNRIHLAHATTVRSLTQPSINHLLHFLLTIVTFGCWGMVWWWLILKSRGEGNNFLAGFDDDYWSYLIERERPPAALYTLKIGTDEAETVFEA
ncbi:hypothetical protein [Shewanella sp. 10N.286.51.B2]|uniref:hypothetical protein n=1 Tax=Shewanella sp. 10N.286.51.B2 TaxID=3229707 RepID=UPI003557811E